MASFYNDLEHWRLKVSTSSPVPQEKVGKASPPPGAPPSQAAVLEFFRAISPGLPQIEFCIQCGSCGGSCPAATLLDHTPRRLFALIRAGEMEDVLQSNTPWYCVSCYFCMVRCPQEIHITDLMYGLKTLAFQRGYTRNNKATHLSRTFAGYIERYGRSFELGIAARHYLRHPPKDLIATAQMGAGMFLKGRLKLRPERIKGTTQLQKILIRAKELETPL
ncbi:MAG: 4Fe-4S dicluster domain-containing protein [Anaerolineales bacterium]